jgi:hypothetical protein
MIKLHQVLMPNVREMKMMMTLKKKMHQGKEA